MSKKPADIQDYLAGLSLERREGLLDLLATIRAAAPGAEEAFSYSIPAFRLHGKLMLWAAAWKDHYSMYPLTEAMLEEYQAEIATYETSKGTIRFPADKPLPKDLIKKLVRVRAGELKAKADRSAK